MCGITGFIGDPNASAEGSLDRIVGRTTESLRHRRPDGEGVWTDPAAGIALGHRRLAEIDLSPTGAQPMLSANGRYVITCNGEPSISPSFAKRSKRAASVSAAGPIPRSSSKVAPRAASPRRSNGWSACSSSRWL